MNQEQLHKIIQSHCLNCDLPGLKKVFHQYGISASRYSALRGLRISANLKQYAVDTALINASNMADLDTIRYLLTSPELKYRANIHVQNDLPLMSLVQSCSVMRAFKDASGNVVVNSTQETLPIIQYLLSSDELKDHANIHANNNNALLLAASSGNNTIIQYMMTLPQMAPHDHAPAYGKALCQAAYHDRLATVELLLTTPSIARYINNSYLTLATLNTLYNSRHEIMEYMLLQSPLIKNEEFYQQYQQFKRNHPNSAILKNFEKIMALYDLNEKLSQQLPKNPVAKKSKKL